jgi:hypothetical protein
MSLWLLYENWLVEGRCDVKQLSGLPDFGLIECGYSVHWLLASQRVGFRVWAGREIWFLGQSSAINGYGRSSKNRASLEPE